MPIYPVKQPRPWYRPHASTWTVMFLALAAMTFWNVAGYFQDPEPGVFSDELWAHGWPSTYLHRVVFRDPALLSRRTLTGRDLIARWQDSLTWRLWEGAEDFRRNALALDVAIGLAIVGAVGAAFELWRRRRAHLLQLYLGELLLLIVLVSVSMAVARHAYMEVPRTESLLRELSSQGFSFGYARSIPECLHVLLPGNNFKPGDRVISAVVHDRYEPRELAVLSEFPHLEEVNFLRSALSEDDVAGLGALPRLKRLCVDVPLLTDDQLSLLARLGTLQELTIRQSQLCGSGLSHLDALPRLRSLELDMSDAPPGSTTLTPLAKLVYLRRLTLQDHDWRVLTQNEIAAIAKLTELEELAIWGYEFQQSDDPGLLLRSLPKLKLLKLGTDDVPDQLFVKLPACSRLEDLTVSFHQLNDERVAILGRCRCLQRLRILGGQIGRFDHVVEQLAELTDLKLQTLDISNTNATDAAIDSLASMRSLRRVDLTCCQFVTPAGVRRLKTLRPDLKVVSRGGPCNWEY